MLTIGGADLSQVAYDIQYADSLNNGASSLTFSYPVERAGLFPNGSTVVFRYGGADVFYGFLFTSRADRSTVRCTAYDQLRYLRAQGYLLREVETAEQFCSRVFSQIGDRIRMGTVEPTGMLLGQHLFDGQTYLDMIYHSISESCKGNGYLFALRDEAGAITLRDVFSLRLPLVVGDGSMATGYEYVKSIDEDTANYVAVGKDNGKAGLRDVVVAEDGANIARWGRLMLQQKASDDQNEAQMNELAQSLLAEKNRETQTLSVDCVGDLRVRAGCGVKVLLSAAGLSLWALCTRANHSFDGVKHTMQLELEYGRWKSWTL